MDYLQSFKKELDRKWEADQVIDYFLKVLKHYTAYITEKTGKPYDPKETNKKIIDDYKFFMLCTMKEHPKLINSRLKVIEKFYDFLISTGLITENPAKEIKKIIVID